MPTALRTRPSWLNSAEYPFESRIFESRDGRMHYVDEGSGPVIVMVHGTPTWSFLYRKLIRSLSRTHRVIALDLLGFGLSEKPGNAPYRPADHARRLVAMLDEWKIERPTLVVHDFGGPIGLSYAIDRPQAVRSLVLFNTWMWSLADDRRVAKASRVAAGAVGRFLYRQLNFSPRVLMKLVMGDKRKLTPEIHRHYVRVFASARERTAPWVLARELAGSADWYDSLWRRREGLRNIPAVLLWGMKDPTFGRSALERWRHALPQAEVVRFPDAGHFVQEEVDVETLAPYLAR